MLVHSVFMVVMVATTAATIPFLELLFLVDVIEHAIASSNV